MEMKAGANPGKETEWLSLAEYAYFLLRWQHAHPSTRLQGKEGFRQVLRRLEGYGTYPLLWKRDILPVRVEDFDPVWLEELIEDGALVFGRFCLMGEANYTPGGGTVFCEPASLGYLFVWNQPPNYTWPDTNPELKQCCLDAHDHLVQSGGATAGEVITAIGWESALVEVALWHLYTGGIITNTAPACLFESTCISFLPGIRPRGTRHEPPDCERERQRLRKYGLRAEEGQWVACAARRDAVTPEPLAEEERFRRRVRKALRIYGIASVSMLTHHFRGPFAQVAGKTEHLAPAEIHRACEELVARGEAIRGDFVRELPGDQYALSGVLEEVRIPEGDSGPMVMVNSLDPASIYISIIPVPSVTAYCFPGRFMVLDRGELVAVVDQKTGGKRRFVARNIHLLQAMTAEGVCRLIDAMAEFLKNGGLYDVLEVRGIEGLSADSDAIEEVFVQRGFEVDGSRWQVALDGLEPWEGTFLPWIETEAASGDLIGAVQAVFEQVAGMPIVRQRGQGRTTLKLKGRLLVNAPDGKEPVFVSVSIKEGQEDLFAAVPEAFKAHARLRRDPYASHVEVRIPLDTDIRGKAFQCLVEVWVAAARRRLQKARRGSRKAKEGEA